MEYAFPILLMSGFLAGFVDSIAGGGGLISLPVITLILGPGAYAIGTNKVAAVLSSVVALLVYRRQGHFEFKKSFAFALWIGVGAFCGSLVTPLLPHHVFQWVLIITCPIILWLVWRKDLWVAQSPAKTVRHLKAKRFLIGDPKILISGLFCGFYDGAWGPGAGTFMLLALLFFGRLPLLSAIAASKFANSSSAAVSLISYACQGYVFWDKGAMIALGVMGGAFLGARQATRNAAKIVRPMLVTVVVLLVAKLLQTTG